MTRLQLLTALVLGCPAVVPAASADAPPATADYREPSAAVTRLLTAAPPPQPLLHARSGRVALLFREAVIPLERLARPYLGLAGYRFDPITGVSGAAPLIERVEVIDVGGTTMGPRAEWRPGAGARLRDVRFSPDGRRLAALRITEGPARLAVFDVVTGSERILDVPVNTAWGESCTWVAADGLLCRVLLEDRGTMPSPRIVPTEVEHRGGPAPIRTYANLLENAHEDALFEYHFTTELAHVGLDDRVRRLAATRGLLSRVEPSPAGDFAIVTRLERPFSRLVPARYFPSSIEVWDLQSGERRYASAPTGFGVESPESGSEGPRRFAWKPGTPTTIGWVAPLPEEASGPGQRWMALEPPYDQPPREIARSDRPIRTFGWTTAGTPYFTTTSEGGAEVHVYAVFDGAAKEIWTARTGDRYGDPGRALRVDGADGPVLEVDGRIFLAGDGLGPDGPRPFLDALDVRRLTTERLFSADPGVFEIVLGVLDRSGSRILTSRETETSPPNLFVVQEGVRTAVRPFATPYPDLEGVERRVLSYRRADGVALSGTLYLPAGRRDGPLPALLWIYPYEFDDTEQAGQLDVRSFRFHAVKGPSPLALVLEGYAVLLNPTVPIVYGEEGPTDDYVAQLAASAEAAADHLVAIGVAAPGRIAVAGRSYGAFSSANLLVHSRRFATAIAMSGAYNRTLTPFGFQHEHRSFWDATELYASISPFFHVDQIEAPMLLVHGGADENPGTPPLQARRFFHALVGKGVPSRYVELPFEGHHYWARENVLDAAAEMIDWLDRTIGDQATRAEHPPTTIETAE